MLDWELAHVGDPVEDLANFAHRLYRGKLKIPSGVLTVSELRAAYAQAAGWEVSERSLTFWLVFNSVRSTVTFHYAGACSRTERPAICAMRPSAGSFPTSSAT